MEIRQVAMYIEQSLCPDEPPPASLDTLEERADYVARVCAAFDFGIPPEAHGDHLPADEYLVAPAAAPEVARCSMNQLVAVASKMPRRSRRSTHSIEVQHLLLLEDSGANWRQDYGPATASRLRQSALVARELLLRYRRLGAV